MQYIRDSHGGRLGSKNFDDCVNTMTRKTVTSGSKTSKIQQWCYLPRARVAELSKPFQKILQDLSKTGWEVTEGPEGSKLAEIIAEDNIVFSFMGNYPVPNMSLLSESVYEDNANVTDLKQRGMLALGDRQRPMALTDTQRPLPLTDIPRDGSSSSAQLPAQPLLNGDVGDEAGETENGVENEDREEGDDTMNNSHTNDNDSSSKATAARQSLASTGSADTNAPIVAEPVNSGNATPEPEEREPALHIDFLESPGTNRADETPEQRKARITNALQGLAKSLKSNDFESAAVYCELIGMVVSPADPDNIEEEERVRIQCESRCLAQGLVGMFLRTGSQQCAELKRCVEYLRPISLEVGEKHPIHAVLYLMAGEKAKFLETLKLIPEYVTSIQQSKLATQWIKWWSLDDVIAFYPRGSVSSLPPEIAELVIAGETNTTAFEFICGRLADIDHSKTSVEDEINDMLDKVKMIHEQYRHLHSLKKPVEQILKTGGNLMASVIGGTLKMSCDGDLQYVKIARVIGNLGCEYLAGYVEAIENYREKNDGCDASDGQLFSLISEMIEENFDDTEELLELDELSNQSTYTLVPLLSLIPTKQLKKIKGGLVGKVKQVRDYFNHQKKQEEEARVAKELLIKETEEQRMKLEMERIKLEKEKMKQQLKDLHTVKAETQNGILLF